MKKIHIKKVMKQKKCPSCYQKICPCVIDQIRDMENAMVVAKQAIESLSAVNQKQILQIGSLLVELDNLRARAA